MHNKVANFLEINGFKPMEDVIDNEFRTYKKNEDMFVIDVALDKSEIVFVDGSGDFLHINFDYYALIGALIEYRAIPCNYKSVYQINN